MLSVFPSLFIFGIFAPLILRLAVGVLFFYSGYQHFTKENEVLAAEFTSRFGSFAKTFALLVAGVEVILGAALIVGFLTQVAALLGMIFVLKLMWFKKEYPILAKHEKAVYVLAFVVLLSLLITGAGAPAIDLPL